MREKSKEKRRPGRPRQSSERKQAYSLTLTAQTEQVALIMGDRNRSKGVEQLFSGLPVFYQVKAAIALAAAGEPISEALAQALLEELESLEIDRVYKEACLEGLVKEIDEPLIY